MSKLIELDAAIAETWKDTGYSDPLNVMTAIRDRLEALPTVDAIPVRMGRWVDKSGVWYCSGCNKQSVDDYNFCPYCGMDMRWGNGNETD